MKRGPGCKIAGVTVGIFLLGCFYCSIRIGSMWASDKRLARECIRFKCDVGRWPSTSDDLFERATSEYAPVLRSSLDLQVVRFTNSGQNLLGSSVHTKFTGYMGYTEVITIDAKDLPCDRADEPERRYHP